ncbi:Hypothetical predicted protein [Lecanosticta acicola]|uniref:Uncharacterized protein n=1 Tax=Lecanosticta acicola TaxID=111012 RepID=A0AAI9EC60_9PEZI|nr:Hypothetical predicted protein [Lecanosticta acicola]
MATAPVVDHHFNGDSRLLNATFERRTELRTALATLQQELSRIEGFPCQVTADIRFNVFGPPAREHVYSVSITDSGFDSVVFARTKLLAGRGSRAASASSPASGHGDRRPSSSRRGAEDDDVMEIRPLKKPRTEGEDGLPTPSRASVSEDPNTSQRVYEVLNYVKDWKDEWMRQGGWLFDTLNGAAKTTQDQHQAMEKKLDSVQDTLGQSINAASATTMAELANITKLLPWLEHCRKTNADKVQAREEKWRSSSATFHDQNRREREAAEKRLDDKLEMQRRLLIKVAEANGVDVDDVSDKPSREASLGAQLTAELNMEALRAEGNGDSRQSSRNEPINIDD